MLTRWSSSGTLLLLSATVLVVGIPGAGRAVPPPGAELLITEFMAKNTVTVLDDLGSYSDWIEIYNNTAAPIDLAGWYLTDETRRLNKWQFPAVWLGSGQFMVVWASDKNRRDPSQPLHTNFKLSDEGEYLGLVRADGVTVASEFASTFPPQYSDVSYGLTWMSGTNAYLARATPGAVNSEGTNFVVAALGFSPRSGWYSNSITVKITSATPEVAIYFTTNGSTPSVTNGLIYSGPITLSGTTVLRAVGVRPGFAGTAAQSCSYLWLDQVLAQDGAGFPSAWGDVAARYTFNPAIISDPDTRALVEQSLLEFPRLSLAMDTDHLFGPEGIYSNPLGDGEAWERPCSLEYIPSPCEPGFQINCGIRMQGNLSREPEATWKHNFRFLFKQIYGSGRLNYHLFEDSPVTEFDTLVLKASFNDHWIFGGLTAQMQRDQWSADTQREMSGTSKHGTYMHLFINGLYWGLYNLQERPDASFAAHHFGGEKSDYDAFNEDELVDGSTNDWNAMLAIAQAGITNDAAYAALSRYLNVPAFIDYLLLNQYIANYDWPLGNWRAAGSMQNGVPFQFFSWDAEWSLGLGNVSVYDDNTWVTAGTPGLIYDRLLQYPEFARLYGDHVQRHLFNGGALTPQRCIDRWMQTAARIDSAIAAESARWGFDHFTNTYLRSDWLSEQQLLRTNWFALRTDILLRQLRSPGLYPELAPPLVTPRCGVITDTITVTMEASVGIVLFTMDGTDPRRADGGMSSNAYVADAPLPISRTMRLSARTLHRSLWSSLVTADFIRLEELPMAMPKISRNCAGAVDVFFVGWPGASYTVMTSPDLVSWTALTNLTAEFDGRFRLHGNEAHDDICLFYRLRWP